MPLPRVATFTQWLAGRAGRRKLCEQLCGDQVLRRATGDPAKDAVLRALHAGERGGTFASTAQLEAQSRRALATLQADQAPGVEPAASATASESLPAV